ncbi:flavin reductase family protein [Streptomyces xiaopingdaonensis]|uniref:flavin reductase family protein n=1 Tax=Streptomyces xiaopingdaonensis TaxID=1565415 RepID=UPI0003019361|nr:flavin reductase family protein [Streptomyces xiaopingdaonensis]
MSTALLSTRPAAAPETRQPSVPAEEFRAAMAAVASPVTVVTCYDGAGTPRGLTASAVSSLSLDPPLFLVCLDRRSGTHGALTAAPSFCVNLTGPGNEALAGRFAGPAEKRFPGVPLVPSPDADRPTAPALAEAELRLHCVRHDTVEGGDHTVLIGRITEITGTPHTAGGLLWHRRGFAHAAPAPR